MGAGASVPDSLDEAQAQALAGDQWDVAKFAEMKDLQGLVTKQAFLAAAAAADNDLMEESDMFDLSSGSDDDSALAPDLAFRRPSVVVGAALPVKSAEELEEEKQQAVDAALIEERKKQEQAHAEALAAQAAMLTANSIDAEKVMVYFSLNFALSRFIVLLCYIPLFRSRRKQ